MIHRFRFVNIRVLAAIGLLSIAGCNGEAPESDGTVEQTAADDAVLARVNGTVITTADLERAIISTPRPDQFEYIDAQQRQELLESLIDRKLMAAQARADGLDRDTVVANALATAAGDEFERERILAQAYMDTELSSGQFTADIIEAYYRDHATEFTEAERVHVTRAVMPDEESARKAREWLIEGIDADELKTRTEGRGLVSTIWFQQREEPGPIEQAAFALQPGEVSELFPVRSGLAVLRADERRAARLRPLVEVRASIVARLDQERRSRGRADLLLSLRKNADVTIDQAALAAYQWTD
jgi:parvulin-like peptidyl-prolyl isomerase